MCQQSDLYVFNASEEFFKKMNNLLLIVEFNYIQNKNVIKK
jgi:hypothetical protein